LDILIASNNRDKLEEIRQIFRLPGIRFRYLHEFPAAPEVEEDGNSLHENALKKARVLSEFSGLPAISDDTGLEVDALDGKPGVYSARFAGEQASYRDNVRKMLRVMQGIPVEKRQARFRTVALFYGADAILTGEGCVEGSILTEERGEQGFGYDPIFYVSAASKTYAEMNTSEKNAISHRGRAFQQLNTRLAEYLHSATTNV